MFVEFRQDKIALRKSDSNTTRHWQLRLLARDATIHAFYEVPLEELVAPPRAWRHGVEVDGSNSIFWLNQQQSFCCRQLGRSVNKTYICVGARFRPSLVIWGFDVVDGGLQHTSCVDDRAA